MNTGTLTILLLLPFTLLLSLSANGTSSDGIEINLYAKSLQSVSPATKALTTDDVSEFIPMDIPSGSSSETVQAKILGHSINALIRKVTQKNKKLAKMTNQVTDSLHLNADVSFAPATPNSQPHKLSFQTRLLASVATVRYSGLLDAAFTYNIRSNEALLEFEPKISLPIELLISQAVSPLETRSLIKLKVSY